MAKKEESYEPFGSNVSEGELTEEYAGIGKRVFVCRKEDFERQPGLPYINKEGNLVTFVGQGENKMEWEHREELMPDNGMRFLLLTIAISPSPATFLPQISKRARKHLAVSPAPSCL